MIWWGGGVLLCSAGVELGGGAQRHYGWRRARNLECLDCQKWQFQSLLYSKTNIADLA